jgi:hypothetical protein
MLGSGAWHIVVQVATLLRSSRAPIPKWQRIDKWTAVNRCRKQPKCDLHHILRSAVGLLVGSALSTSRPNGFIRRGQPACTMT